MSDYETLNIGSECKTNSDANSRIFYNLRLNSDVIDESSFKEFIKGVDGLNIPVIDDQSFKIFDLLRCPNCPKGGLIMSSNDGNRNQTCLSCKTVLMKDGKMINQTKNQKKDNTVNEKYTDGELEIYSEDDPNIPDYMKELSELVKQKK